MKRIVLALAFAAGSAGAAVDVDALWNFNDPAASAAVFVPNPFPELAGGTLYKTGDLARHLPDGNIEIRDGHRHSGNANNKLPRARFAASIAFSV